MRSQTIVASFLTIIFALALISSMMTVAQARVGVTPPPPQQHHRSLRGRYGSWRCWDDTQCHKKKGGPPPPPCCQQ
ncbi:hypothetical protein HanPI659440_Chr16g0642031 [Helianthus annuus]|nr:hypothetical protein HanPI659440_Chr16g0642031 [Helianthus annuus]